nr:YciI family protein [Tistrella bauzanensis]
MTATVPAPGNGEAARRLMADHNAWLAQGFDDGVFQLAGSLRPVAGGAILVHGVSRDEIEARVMADPFVVGGVVTPQILEVAPARSDARLAFLAA